MKHRGHIAGSILLGAGIVLAAASAPALASAKQKHTAIATVKTKLGRVVSSPKGHVMFRFMKDGKTSKCNKTCQSVWPPVTSKSQPTAGAHIKSAKLGLTSKGQVTYYGHPLYYYSLDPKPGKTRGNGIKEFGAHWYVVSPTGKPVKSKPTGPTGPAQVSTGMVGAQEVLTSSDGHTLYELSSETDSPPSFTCTGGCPSVWPPLLTKGAPTAAGDAMTSELGTVMRPDGTTQVTYNHHPLYDYSGDTKAGTAKGDGLYDPPGYWHDLDPSGNPPL